jgi:hypothetical protein
MDIILDPILAFAQFVDIRHVLVLNLLGWAFKGCMWHSQRLYRWTDIIPVNIGLIGVVLAYIDPATGTHPIIHGLANAGLAWMLHQGVKRTQEQIKDYKTQKIKTLGNQRHKGTGDGKDKEN